MSTIIKVQKLLTFDLPILRFLRNRIDKEENTFKKIPLSAWQNGFRRHFIFSQPWEN